MLFFLLASMAEALGNVVTEAVGHGWEQVCREFEEGLLQAVHAC